MTCYCQASIAMSYDLSLLITAKAILSRSKTVFVIGERLIQQGQSRGTPEICRANRKWRTLSGIFVGG